MRRPVVLVALLRFLAGASGLVFLAGASGFLFPAPAQAGLYYSGETVAELPSRWRGFLVASVRAALECDGARCGADAKRRYRGFRFGSS